ncbi:MAG: hypothetical protein HWD58_05905 [Bacteroidota bacterium]|nr:MAG: hypothetical protein HWD58_05905 [Bacteroidota bacterium]
MEHKAPIGEMIAWPTPFQNQVTVAFESTSDGEAEILVTDLYGHTITHEVILIHEGRNTRQFQGLDRLSAGITSCRCKMPISNAMYLKSRKQIS